MVILEGFKIRMLKQDGELNLEDKGDPHSVILAILWEELAKAFMGLLVMVTNYRGSQLAEALVTNHKEFCSRIGAAVMGKTAISHLNKDPIKLKASGKFSQPKDSIISIRGMDLVAQDLTPVSTKGAKDLVLMDLEMAAAPEMAGASITKRMKANVDEDGGCKGSRWSASGIVETSRFDYNDYNSVFFNDNFFLNN